MTSNLRSKGFLILLVIGFQSIFLKAQPTDNPIANFYSGSEGYPAWTDEIKWNNVYNMATQNYSGCSTCSGNDFEKFKYVRDIAYATGGGVLYYPGGTYTFDVSDGPNDEGLMLKKGVVIRGERPSSDINAVTVKDINNMSVTDHGLKAMPTKFMFATTNLNNRLNGEIAKMWNCVGIKKGTNEAGLHQVNHVGICWVEMQYGYIFFGFDATGWASTWGQAGYQFGKSIDPWKSTRNPNGTHPMDAFNGNKIWQQDSIMMGTKRFVFGVSMKYCGVPNYVLPHGLPVDSFYCEDSPWHFGAKIAVYGSNVMVANNVIWKAPSSFVFRLRCKNAMANNQNPPIHTINVPYDFGKGLSIDINKNYIAGYMNRSQVENPSSQYAPNVLMRDNWIYNHSNKGTDAGGSWMVIKNNINRRERYVKNVDIYDLGLPFPIWGTFTSNGKSRTGQSADDYMARSFTLSTNCAWVDSNQLGGTGTDYDNSGEGIIIQDHLNGSECYSTAITNNTNAKPSAIPGNPAWMGIWNSHGVGLFLGYNRTMNGISFENFGSYGADVSEIQHVNSVTGLPLNVPGNVVKPNVMDYRRFACPGDPTPGSPQISVKDTGDFVLISWNDVENEAGYRVERRRQGNPNWTIIAYRPRQETGGNVTFGFGSVANGFIATNDGYPPAPYNHNTWDGKVRNMNPPVWRDYTKMAGLFEYRVVAIGCNDTDIGRSDSIPILVSTKSNIARQPKEISVFPVPTSDYIQIVSENLQGAFVKILNLQGKEVMGSKKSNGIQMKISTNSLKPGIYMIHVEGIDGFFQKRFTVQ